MILNATAQVIPLPRLTKRCPRCEQVKAASAFHQTPSRGDGLGSHCKPCDSRVRVARYKQDPAERQKARERSNRQRERDPKKVRIRDNLRQMEHRLKRLGITLADARDMLRNQSGLCANRACGKPISLDVHAQQNHGERAVVDHCHATGKVRGVLCQKCNLSAGLMEKNRNMFLGLSEYLARHST